MKIKVGWLFDDRVALCVSSAVHLKFWIQLVPFVLQVWIVIHYLYGLSSLCQLVLFNSWQVGWLVGCAVFLSFYCE
jgi:hypothetical protein